MGSTGREQILLEVVESVTGAGELPVALNRLASLALRAVGGDRCAIFSYDPVQGLRPAAAATLAGDDQDLWRRFRAMDPIDISEPSRLSAWRGGRTVTLDDAAASPLVPESWKRVWGSKSLAFSFVRVEGDIYGLAVEYVRDHHTFTAEEVRLLDAIAGAAGAALRGARLVGRLQREIEIEKRLSDCTAALLKGNSSEEVLDMVAEGFACLFPGSSCSINLLSQDRAGFRPVATRGLPPSGEEIRLDGLPQRDVLGITTRWQRDPRAPVLVREPSSFREWRGLVPPEIGTGMLVPLWDGNAVLGFVAVGRARDPFTEDEVRVAAAFANEATMAVAHARLGDAVQARLRAIDALRGLSETVVRTSNLRAALRSLNRGACATLGIRCTRLTFSVAALSAALGTRPPTPTERAMIRSWLTSTPAPTAVGKLVAAPVRVQGRVHGLLWVRVDGELDEAKADFIGAIADGLGEVAHKARLRHVAERRARELAVAAERERIARDLHDTVGQTFYELARRLDLLSARIEDPDHAAEVAEVRAVAVDGVTGVRSAVEALSSAGAREAGLVPSLRGLARDFARATGTPAEFRLQGGAPSVSEEAGSALYRVAREVLVNVDRHARATGLVMCLITRDDEVELAIRDDGVGLDQREVADWASSSRFALRAMDRSLRAVGGRLEIAEAHPRGVLVRARVRTDWRDRSRSQSAPAARNAQGRVLPAE